LGDLSAEVLRAVGAEERGMRLSLSTTSRTNLSRPVNICTACTQTTTNRIFRLVSMANCTGAQFFGSESGSKRAKMTTKIEKVKNFMF
jgi:hypothetical protein